MTPPIFFAVIVGIPLVISIVLRVKPLFLFVAIVTGYFWVQFLGSTAVLIVESVIHVSKPEVVTNIGLLLIPVILTFIVMKKTITASSLPFQFVLLLGNSLLLATFLVPLLSPGVIGAIYSTIYGNIFRQSHDVLVAAVAGLQLLVMFLTQPKKHITKHK